MDKDITCNQISALISYYLKDELNPLLKSCFEQHLANCPACAKKIRELKLVLARYGAKEKAAYDERTIRHHKIQNRLSAYMDNELSQDENIKIKKMTISNPTARQELETMYKFRKMMHSAFEKTKNDSKFDYSKNIISKISDTEYATDYFYKLSILFVLLITAIIAGFIYLYF